MSSFLASVNGTREVERETTLQHLLIPFRQVGVKFFLFFPPLFGRFTLFIYFEWKPMTRSLIWNVGLLSCLVLILFIYSILVSFTSIVTYNSRLTHLFFISFLSRVTITNGRRYYPIPMSVNFLSTNTR